MQRLLLLPLLLAACAAEPTALPPESDAHAVMDPERDITVEIDGQTVRVTDLEGAEDGEAISPDGRLVAFVAASPEGIASVWVADVPAAGEQPISPLQLTNVGLERTPGQAPAGFVPPPDRGPVRWLDADTVAWTAEGREYTAELPR